MKLAIAAAAAAIAAALAAAAGPVAASDGPSAKIEYAVARVVVIVEDRADIGVEIEQGSSGLPALQVRRRGDDVVIHGGLKGGLFGNSAVRNCQSGPEGARQPGEGASVEVRQIGTVRLADAPLIVIRTPRAVEVDVNNGAVFGAVGRDASSIELNNGGCGDWAVANTEGTMSLSIMGSGDMRAGTSNRLEASIMGSGDIQAGATRGLEANVMGSGDITATRVDGPVEANIMGSGDINIPGTVTSIEANIMGAGDINVGGATGAVTQSIMGSGDIVVAGQAVRQSRRDR
ncbi:GIN domain-containing protein [Brevundimonas sp. Root1423]|uniref:GIN domain-containing protein n=1 Tax=Brevundimonas sp. Root1423 TaxID=1736462 RepID=UPI0006F36DD9|nr:DUF2807 domain-containing protein [Brevundimonas sp. Root1423]KQY91242.1 hypothetical protein ASD25_18925 [Brevundimonas sp. Root1423]